MVATPPSILLNFKNHWTPDKLKLLIPPPPPPPKKKKHPVTYLCMYNDFS